MLDKKEVGGALSLSCVESYFLAWLKRYYDVSRLYGHSFVEIRQVFGDFFLGATYEHYDKVSRMQDVAERYGLVQHSYNDCSSEEAMRWISKTPKDALCLIRVNSNFFKNFKRSAWREDHYICVNNKLQWINDYPLSEGCFSVEEFDEIFDNAICIYRTKNLLASFPDRCTEAIKKQDFFVQNWPNSLLAWESAVGILRVTRKRLGEYYSKMDRINTLFKAENEYLDKLYFNIHLTRLKARGNETELIEKYEGFQNHIEEILKIEKCIAKEL